MDNKCGAGVRGLHTNTFIFWMMSIPVTTSFVRYRNVSQSSPKWSTANCARLISFLGKGPLTSMYILIIWLLELPWNRILPVYSSNRQHAALHMSIS